MTLEPRPKRFTDDGGHRAAPPEETLARARHLISPITGLIAGIGPLEGRDHPLRPVYAAVYLDCPAGDSPSFGDFHRASGGKGRTPAQARAGALCEAIERYSATFHGDAPHVRREPSAYFRRQCFIAIEPDEPCLEQAIPWFGEDRAIFGTDVPHVDHDAGIVGRALALRGRLPDEAVRKILWDNAARFYGIDR